MTYQQIQKSARLLQKKQPHIALSATENSVQTNSPSSKVTTFSVPSQTERDTIRKSFFGTQGEQIQTKLMIGKPGDKYEQEADRAAARVINQIEASRSSQLDQSQSIQREAMSEEDTITKSLADNGLIQRVVHGTDPLINYARGDDKSLLYGLHPFRQLTQQRLKPQDKAIGTPQPIRTIDDYNAGIGINGLMTLDQSPIGIFTVREALSDPDPVANWGKYFPSFKANVAANADLQAWIQKLAQNASTIGLYDFGDKTSEGIFGFREAQGLKKIKSKNRFTKNLKNSERSDQAVHLHPKDIHAWLAPERTFSQAINLFTKMSEEQKNALRQWIYKAFFRRTSKLGIDFVTQDLNARVNFNTASAINPHSDDPFLNTPRRHGLRFNDINMDQSKDRSITISEYRHIMKHIGNDPAKVNFYNEY
ncbi:MULTISPECIES: hypothetical protein [Nostocales]|uniref:Uncharacterized protein n=3 Tax=Nostocales TaxID=1161 RepID=A0A0C1QTX9_9CYAN|nr:hypothetical protein [Tolypothrix bouteillei]KAF3889243.1 hypothetical protein DA73_0400029995 [Tolypothrix bouteillei VB521301]